MGRDEVGRLRHPSHDLLRLLLTRLLRLHGIEQPCQHPLRFLINHYLVEVRHAQLVERTHARGQVFRGFRSLTGFVVFDRLRWRELGGEEQDGDNSVVDVAHQRALRRRFLALATKEELLNVLSKPSSEVGEAGASDVGDEDEEEEIVVVEEEG